MLILKKNENFTGIPFYVNSAKSICLSMRNHYTGLLIFLLFFISSCATQKYQTINYGTEVPKELLQPVDYLLRPGDQLSIQSFNNLSSVLYESTINNSAGGAMVPVFEVVVDNNGYIALPRAGRIKAAGLTQKQAALAVNDAYKPTINNPEFDVKIMSMKVRVLGAVNKQGAYVMERENMTLADALALAEGVKYENMSKKLMIMRDGQSMEFRIRAGDLANPVLNGIIIRDNDVVYVQPSQASINAPKVAQYTAFLAPIGTIIAALTLYSTIQGLRKQ